MKKITSLVLTILMLVSMMAPMSILAAEDAATTDARTTVYLPIHQATTKTWDGTQTINQLSAKVNEIYLTGNELVAGTVEMSSGWSASGLSNNQGVFTNDSTNTMHFGFAGESTPYKTGDVSATFYADGLKAGGLYRVDFVEMRQNTATSNGEIGITVTHKNGTSDEVVLNPAQNSRKWTTIGIFNFSGDGSKDEFVKVVRKSGTIRISAVRFTPITNDDAISTNDHFSKIYENVGEGNDEYWINISTNKSTANAVPVWFDPKGNVEFYGSFSTSKSASVDDPMKIAGINSTNTATFNMTEDSTGQGKYFKFFTTNIPAGRYRVKIWNIFSGQNTNNTANITIKSAAGETTEQIAARSYANETWVPVGIYDFNGSSARKNGFADEYIKIMNSETDYVRVSAIAFEPVDKVVTISDKETDTNFTDASAWNVVSDNANLKGPNGEAIVATSAKDNSITFKPTTLKNAYYDVSFLKLLTTEETGLNRPTVAFEIKRGNSDPVKHIFDFTQDEAANVSEWMDLGCYQFTGNGEEYVKVTKIGGKGTLNASSVKFALNDDAAAEKEPYRGEGIIKDSAEYKDKWTSLTDEVAGGDADDFRGPKGNLPVYTNSTESGIPGPLAYTTEGVDAGTYDVYWYTMVTEATKNTSDIEVNVYHAGLRDYKVLSNAGIPVGTKKWTYIGTYNFDGNAKNEYISVVAPSTQLLFAGGVKFVKKDVIVNDTENAEPIIITCKDSDMVDTHGVRWENSSIENYDGSGTVYANNSGDMFTFKTDSVPAGKYEVELYSICFGSDVREDKNASIIVRHNGNELDVQDYDNTNGGSKTSKWITVGTYNFTNTRGEGITLRGNDVDRNTSVRAGAIKLTPVAYGYDEFYVPVAMAADTEGTLHTNATASHTANNTSFHKDYTADGLVHAIAGGTDEKTFRYYLPDYGTKTRAGTYEVYTVNLNASKGTFTYNVNSAADNGEKELTNLPYAHDSASSKNGKWVLLDKFEFKGGNNGEYIEFVRAAQQVSQNSRIGAIKFVYKDGETEETFTPAAQKVVYDVKIGDAKDWGGIRNQTLDSGSTTVYENNINPVSIRATAFNDTDSTVTELPNIYVALYATDAELGTTTLVDVVELETEATELKPGETAYYFGLTKYHDFSTMVGQNFKAFVWGDDLTPVEHSDDVVEGDDVEGYKGQNARIVPVISWTYSAQ